ncbi:GATOR2 complex protein WDR24 isoform X1 [Danaus plexippus]|uniref:GATOR2 complex protein WDR24 isoform X1 n=1 Tax=Danaus plexippus TaxID=13037 RepID=UPI002AB19FE9|nr:GATOR2 complex protein WDR24 isoform X1 [Danaus plexippus]
MIPSNTICVSQEGPANALALNKDCTQVVIAGRNVFKVFSIGENEFSEVCNLRVGKNLNLNFSSIDVAWSTIEENTLATAATNGAVVVWNLGRSGRSKQEHVFSDHKRTVNKVSFHLTEPSLLISGSQDGMMKYFDLRMKEVARTFISNTESIRDVQFSPHAAHVFAAVSENGTVQLWDSRRHERAMHQFTAHSGPVFACDWHPDVPWLATASRDKTIKVWDIHARPNLEHTIYTIASVGHVKWRPQRKFQVASCALVLDCAVHVWDVRRPHVPLATFAEHRDVTTAIAWQATPHAFLSTSRDCSLYRHKFSEAAHPVLWANPQAVCVSSRGQLASALPDAPLPRPRTCAPERLVPGLGRKQPTAGSLSASAQAALERAFPGSASSSLARHTPVASQDQPVLACAHLYRIRGQPPHVLAEHNAKVARDHHRYMVSHVWEVVRSVYSARAVRSAPAPPPPRAPPPVEDTPPLPLYSAVEEEPLEEVEEWENRLHQHSGVLGLPTHAVYIPPAKYAREGEDGGWVSAASAHYVDVEAADWTLPDEAFPLRAPPAPPAPPPAPSQHTRPNEQEHDAESVVAGGTGVVGHAGPSSPGSSGSGTGSSRHEGLQRSSSQNCGSSEGEGGEGGEGAEGGALCVREGAGRGTGRAALDPAPLLALALRLHADLGDVQTAAVVCLALQDHRSDLFPYIDESLQEQWLLGYIELLQRHKLYNAATEVIRCSWVSGVWSLSQQSTSVAACCARCGRRSRPRAACECAPRAPPDLCAVCHQCVRGLYAWCQGCAHGGHLRHVQSWLKEHQLCPAGCGHACQLA